MNSYIGKVISNFRDFYNEINAATLTGAIDVVVVEQADGTFTCSPFHVRFGKLGVLRSREKVVDIEINGQPQDIHMKLGDSGEAFFVEEVQSTDSEYIPEHLATSPIPVSEFEELYTAATENPRRKSIDLGFNSTITDTLLCENQTSDYTQRRYTGGMEKDYASQKREFLSRQLILGNLKTDQDIIDANIVNTETKSIVQDNEINDHEEVFEMEDLDNMAPSENVITVPKVFSAETIEDPNCLKNNFVPIRVEDLSNLAIKADIDSYDRSEQETKNGKKKRRKKSIMKKKNAQRKISTVGMEQNMNECKDNLSVQDLNIDTKISESSTDKSMLGSDESEEAVGTEADPSPSTRNMNRDIDFHFFSDTELTSANSANTSRPSTPIQSDTEFEFSQRKSEPDDEGHSWAWGQLPVTGSQSESTENKQDQQAERNSMLSGMFSFMKKNKHVRPVKDSEGLYLADLSSGNLDPEVAALYFPRKNKNTDADNDCESGNGPSLPQSPNSVEGAKSIDSDFDDASKDVHKHLQDISLSLCGWTQPPNPDNFLRNLITFSDLCNNPSVLESSELVVRINGKYYNWKSAIPIIISLIVYQRPLPQTSVEQLCMHVTETSLEDKLSKPESKSYSWWYWRRSKNPADKNTIQSESTEKNDIKLELEAVPDMPTVASSSMNEKTIITELEKVVINMKDVNINNSNIIENNPKEHLEDGGGYSGSQSSEDSDHTSREMPNKPHPPRTLSEEKYRKTLRLSSEQIATLDLNEGMNEVEFSVTTAYQGTTRCKCHIYRWRYDDKIVISDIDGTITKSDVLGHILPIVGKDWAQSGVAQLFTKIKNNGYKLLYLSARAIGQARVTREYLRSIKQGNLSLPDGPLLLNPTSLISAFHREVIEKKPEQFKIQCLSDIQALFPIESNPFYAGYGNRINDVWAYRAVGIPIVRIFTINHKGELKHELTQTFQSTYTGQSLVVNDVFPQFKKTEIESS